MQLLPSFLPSSPPSSCPLPLAPPPAPPDVSLAFPSHVASPILFRPEHHIASSDAVWGMPGPEHHIASCRCCGAHLHIASSDAVGPNIWPGLWGTAEPPEHHTARCGCRGARLDPNARRNARQNARQNVRID